MLQDTHYQWFISRQTIENGSLIPLKNINDEAKSKAKKGGLHLQWFRLRSITMNWKCFIASCIKKFKFLLTRNLLLPNPYFDNLSIKKEEAFFASPNLIFSSQSHKSIFNRLRRFLREEKLKFLPLQNHQLAIPKNLHCLSGGQNFESKKQLKIPPEFGDFLRRNINFSANRQRRFADSIKNKKMNEAKRSSLELFVTFCFKTKSKAKKR